MNFRSKDRFFNSEIHFSGSEEETGLVWDWWQLMRDNDGWCLWIVMVEIFNL